MQGGDSEGVAGCCGLWKGVRVVVGLQALGKGQLWLKPPSCLVLRGQEGRLLCPRKKWPENKPKV